MKLQFAVEVDEGVWAEQEGCAREDAPNDLRSYVLSTLQGSYCISISHAKVTVVEVPQTDT